MIEASCQVCRRVAPRGRFITHGPGCTLKSDEGRCVEEDLVTPCRYTDQCHLERRRVSVAAGLRGQACWFFTSGSRRPLPDPTATAERQAIQGEDT